MATPDVRSFNGSEAGRILDADVVRGEVAEKLGSFEAPGVDIPVTHAGGRKPVVVQRQDIAARPT